jgi:hypothetical protein
MAELRVSLFSPEIECDFFLERSMLNSSFKDFSDFSDFANRCPYMRLADRLGLHRPGFDRSLNQVFIQARARTPRQC